MPRACASTTGSRDGWAMHSNVSKERLEDEISAFAHQPRSLEATRLVERSARVRLRRDAGPDRRRPWRGAHASANAPAARDRGPKLSVGGDLRPGPDRHHAANAGARSARGDRQSRARTEALFRSDHGGRPTLG